VRRFIIYSFVELAQKEEFLKTQIEQIQHEQIQHYYDVLQVGVDTRQEGLSWIIKALWTLDENVKISRLPKFLDSKAISFLFEYTKMNQELNESTKSLPRMSHSPTRDRLAIQPPSPMILPHGQNTLARKLSAPLLIPGTSKVSNPYSFLARNSQNFEGKRKEILMKRVNNQLKNMVKTTKSKEVIIKDPRIYHLIQASLQKYNQKRPSFAPFSFETDLISNEVLTKENRLQDLKIQIKSLKYSELERIFKEFINHNYTGRYMVSIELLASALTGEEHSLSDLVKLFHKDRDYLVNKI
jgi:hypothetical protein